MSAGGYVLARFSDLDKLSLAAQVLATRDDVVRWDAVEGHVQLVMKLRTPPDGIPSGIMTMEGVSDLIVFEALGRNGAGKRDASQQYAYLFIETTPDGRARVAEALRTFPQTFSVEETEGGCDIVALLSGPTFADIDRCVKERVNPIDGILRIKYNRVIDLIGL